MAPTARNLGAIGWALIVIGILSNEWLLTKAFIYDEGVVEFHDRVFAWCFQIIVFSLGLFLFIRRKKLIELYHRQMPRSVFMPSETNVNPKTYTHMQRIIYCLGSITVFLVISLGFFSFPTADDYMYLYQVSNNTLSEFALFYYLHFGGRGLYVAVINNIDHRSIHQIPYTSLFYALTFVVSVCVMARLSEVEKNGDMAIKFFIYTAVAWLGIYKIGQIVYWASGGQLYILPLCGCLLWMYGLKRIGEKSSDSEITYRQFIYITYFLSGFLISLASLQGSLLLIVFATYLRISHRRDMNTMSRRLIVIGLIGVLIGAVILSVAPGNFVRAQTGEHSMNFNPLNLVANYIRVFFKYTVGNYKMVLLSIFGSVVYNLITVEKFRAKEFRLANYQISGVWLLCALASILPFMLLPDFAALRASIYFIIPFSMFIWIAVQMIMHVGCILVLLPTWGKGPLQVVGVCLASMLLLTAIYVNGVDIRDAANIKKQVERRHRVLTDAESDDDVIIERVEGRVPGSLFFNEFHEEEDYWVNKDAAKYYGITSIRVGKK